MVEALLGPACPRCGEKCVRTHDRRDKRVRDLEVSGGSVGRSLVKCFVDGRLGGRAFGCFRLAAFGG